MITGDALELIKHGRFGQFSLGDTKSHIDSMLGQHFDLESYFSWGVTDDGAHNDGYYAFGDLELHLTNIDGVLKVWLIAVDARRGGFIDDRRSIYFNSHGYIRGKSISKVRELMKRDGLTQLSCQDFGVRLSLRVSPSAALVFEYYPFDGQNADSATFVQIEAHQA